MPKVIAIDGNMVCTLVETRQEQGLSTLSVNFNGYVELLCRRLIQFRAGIVGVKILMLPLKEADVSGWGAKRLLNDQEHPIPLEKISTQMSESLRGENASEIKFDPSDIIVLGNDGNGGLQLPSLELFVDSRSATDVMVLSYDEKFLQLARQKGYKTVRSYTEGEVGGNEPESPLPSSSKDPVRLYIDIDHTALLRTISLATKTTRLNESVIIRAQAVQKAYPHVKFYLLTSRRKQEPENDANSICTVAAVKAALSERKITIEDCFFTGGQFLKIKTIVEQDCKNPGLNYFMEDDKREISQANLCTSIKLVTWPVYREGELEKGHYDQIGAFIEAGTPKALPSVAATGDVRLWTENSGAADQDVAHQSGEVPSHE